MPTTLRSKRHRVLIQVLVDARKAVGFTQAQLATRMHVSQSLIAQVEDGRRRVDVVEFFDFAKAFGITPHELFDRVAAAR